jgi:glutaredoxin 3
MPPVTIYTTPICPYCMQAKALLKRKNVPYTEISVHDDIVRAEMMARANGRRTVPQIFIGDTHVGGCDDIHDLERQGKLDQLLAA